MKKFLVLVLLSLATFVSGQSTSRTITSAQCASLSAPGNAVVLVSVSGTWGGTITVSGVSAAGATTALEITNTSTGDKTSNGSITANGGYLTNVGGWMRVQACGNTVSSGSATVEISGTSYSSRLATPSAGTGTPTPPTSPNSVTQVLTSTPSGGVGGAAAWRLQGVTGRAITAPDVVAAVDRSTWLTSANAGATALSIAQAGSTGFTGNFVVGIKVTGAGAVTLTPTTSTIDGNATLVIVSGQNCTITSLDNANYVSRCIVPGLDTILDKTANYVTTCASDFSAGAVAPTIVGYAVTSATTVTHTLPSTVCAAGAHQFVKNKSNSTFGLYIAPANALTLDGDTTSVFLSPNDTIEIWSDGTNWRSNLGQLNAADTGALLLPDLGTGSGPPSQALPVTAANVPFAAQFVLKIATKISKITPSVQTGVAACRADFGLADVGKNILFHINTGMDCTAPVNIKQTPTTVLTLAPGVYWVWGCINTVTTVLFDSLPLNKGLYQFEQPATPLQGTAANNCTAGVNGNTSLGTITYSVVPSALPTFGVNP